jgi:hypothetical protein
MYGDSWSVRIKRKFKNIDLLKNRNKKNIVCVDKSLLPYLNHISNFVPILPFRPSDRKRNGPETEGRERKLRDSEAKVEYYDFDREKGEIIKKPKKF